MVLRGEAEAVQGRRAHVPGLTHVLQPRDRLRFLDQLIHREIPQVEVLPPGALVLAAVPFDEVRGEPADVLPG